MKPIVLLSLLALSASVAFVTADNVLNDLGSDHNRQHRSPGQTNEDNTSGQDPKGLKIDLDILNPLGQQPNERQTRGVIDNIENKVDDAVHDIRNIIKRSIEEFRFKRGVVDQIENQVDDVVGGLRNIIKRSPEHQRHTRGVIDRIENKVEDVIDDARNIIKRSTEGNRQKRGIIDRGRDIIDKISGPVRDVIDDARNIIKRSTDKSRFKRGLVDEIENKVDDVVDDVRNIIKRSTEKERRTRGVVDQIENQLDDVRKIIKRSPEMNVGGPIEDIRERLFETFMKLNNKTYLEEELPRRLDNFWRRRSMILDSIRNFTEGKSSFQLRENQFMDMDADELKRMGGLKVPSEEQQEREKQEDDQQNKEIEDEEKMQGFGAPGADLPAFVDWRDSGCINTPFNQGSCGSCYAAATSAAMEAMRCIKHGNQKTHPMSHQQIVDCATPSAGYDCNGCVGGWPHEALRYLRDVKSIASSECYPNVQVQNKCMFGGLSKNCLTNSSPTDGDRLKFKTLYNEEDMKQAVARTGPIIMFVQLSENFYMYGSGVFSGNDCSGKWADITHVVTGVGYGNENGQDYWIIKNSYGPNWGDNGYIKLKRGVGACSVGHKAYSIVA